MVHLYVKSRRVTTHSYVFNALSSQISTNSSLRLRLTNSLSGVCVCHELKESTIFERCLAHTYTMTHSYVCATHHPSDWLNRVHNASLIRVQWLTHTCAQWLTHTCTMTHTYVCTTHHSFVYNDSQWLTHTCAQWLTHTYTMTHTYVCTTHHSYMHNISHTCVHNELLVRVQWRTHTCAQRITHTCTTSHSYVCTTNQPYMYNDSLIRVQTWKCGNTTNCDTFNRTTWRLRTQQGGGVGGWGQRTQTCNKHKQTNTKMWTHRRINTDTQICCSNWFQQVFYTHDVCVYVCIYACMHMYTHIWTRMLTQPQTQTQP